MKFQVEKVEKVEKNYVAVHFERLKERFERFEEVHHGRIGFEIGKVVVDPQQDHPRDLVAHRRVIEPKRIQNRNLIHFDLT